MRGGAATAAVSGRIKARTDEGVAEPVTEADQRSNQVLVNGYRQRFPGLSILSEERTPPPSGPLLTEPLALPAGAQLDEDPVFAVEVTILLPTIAHQ